jgi:hypothetical protein
MSTFCNCITENLHTENDMRPEVFDLHLATIKERPAKPTYPRKRRLSVLCVTVCVVVLLASGCSRMEDTNANFTKAINKYYSDHPSCLWPDPVKFPVEEEDASSPREITGYDALVDQTLLVRATDPRKVLVAEGKLAHNYNLSDQGRRIWTADPQQPGFGNLCYGHRVVAGIDSTSPTSSQNGATTNVVYRYTIADVSPWAKSVETQTAFPSLQADLSGNQVGRATLTDTRKGWQVSSAPWAHIYDSDIYK